MMKHFVIGFVFNHQQDEVLLVEKKRPDWQAGRWNGIGGKIEPTDDSPLAAMQRESKEETGMRLNWELTVIFTCPGGTCYVYKAIDNLNCGHENFCNKIHYEQIEDEVLECWPVNALPDLILENLKWLIPLCLSSCQFPLTFHDIVRGGDGNESCKCS